MTEEIRDSERIAAERALGFVKKHVELLDRAFHENDLHTCDMLLTLINQAITKIHQYIRMRINLSRRTPQGDYLWQTTSSKPQ